MPIAINTSRPPSTSTIPSNSSNGAARTTATSRRGGRARSRSPPVVGARMSGISDGQGMPGENPSSAAAAAAAAAAKALSSSGAPGRGPGAWPDNGSQDDPGYYPGYDRSYHGRKNWPRSEGPDSYHAHGYGSSGYNDGYYRYPAEDERMYRSSHRTHRGPASGGYPPDYNYGPGRDPPSSSRSHRAGGTTLVIGGPTPIHVPKVSDMELGKAPRVASASASSVFRGRPSREASKPEDLSQDGNARKILMSLRTPSTSSFEEKSPGKLKKSDSSLSPNGPPRIQSSNQGDHLFEPQRSLEGNKSAALDMAPSFTLFNQSFDSFGDAHYFNVDSSLQVDSFGIGRTGSSNEHEASHQFIHKSSSGGHAGAPHLNGTESAALTIGYSPVNSFSNASASTARRSGNMMVLGGTDTRSSSPTQVLSLYRSYSGSGRFGPLEDSHLRMSVGSFGAQSMSYGRPFPEAVSSPNYYLGPVRSQESLDRSPPFYSLLVKYKAAFESCTFLLPGLKAALLEPPLDGEETRQESFDAEGSLKAKWSPTVNAIIGHQFGDVHREAAPQDILVARRRVDSSVCAFGGNLNKDLARASRQSTTSERSSIFRDREGSARAQAATVTPSSTASQGGRFLSVHRIKYEEQLASRYYENESRLSWEFEESPPVEIPAEQEDEAVSGDSNIDDRDKSEREEEKKSDSDTVCHTINDGESSSKRPTSASPQPKMRYRCKLCGQPKQNHTCPYQQSLARSIGVMVYPAVNAFTACEPGKVAAPLSEMNNFVDIQKDCISSNESSPNRPSPERVRHSLTVTSRSNSNQVTPESMRSSPRHISSPASFAAATPGRTPKRKLSETSKDPKKRMYTQMNGTVSDQSDLLFVESMELKPEQFRTVSSRKSLQSPDAFRYPVLPLPYAQRKRLSDNLFSLSNEIPKLTDECAQVLREAREKDMWDLAVAELMTQVIVIIHCPDGDHRFEGLRQYLLTLGIAC